MENAGDDEAQEEELERFDDFTLASSWERFISEIEGVCRLWLADGPKHLLEKGAVCLGFSKNLYKVKSVLKYAMKSYCMEYYFETSNENGKVMDWNCSLHDLQLAFGVKDFLVISPQSASGVVLDAPEASKLLSSVAIALSNCSSLWPAFVPVHDPSRKAYIGIQNMGTVFTRRFEADRIARQVPVKLMHLEGLYELFVSKFGFSILDFSVHSFRVQFTMKLTYRTQSYDYDDDDDNIHGADEIHTESGEVSEVASRNKTQWDDDCPWSEWYSAEDPVKGFELTSIWSEKAAESSVEMAELENASPHEAGKWLLLPVLSPNLLDDAKGDKISFASQLRLLVDALYMSLEAQFMEDFVAAENSGSENMKSTAVTPPHTVLDRVLKDLFHEGDKLPNFSKGEHKNSRSVKGAPLESLFVQFCLHSLWFGNCNIHAIAMLWVEFVREVRWCWEESQQLPKMPPNGSIDLSTCLINQKLQMLAICIEKKCQSEEEYQDCVESKDINIEDDGGGGEYSSDMHDEKDDREGSSGEVGSTMLLKSYKKLHAPFTQDAPLMTEDMHEERLRAVEALGDSFSFSGQLERDVLSSDMSAFKAANPDAVFEDFIRWHSPGDWVHDEDLQTSKDVWPPQGQLSDRMSGHGNSWRQIWSKAAALPASEQKPLFDPNREGEKVLHYLETLRPNQLLEQIVCTAFRASADTLQQTTFGDLKQMATKFEQLYPTMASTLKRLQANHLTMDSEIIEDLRRLCAVFEHVEKLVTLAASLHRKFLQAPRLSVAIFTDFYKFYLPRTGTGLPGADFNMEFDKKQQVMIREREVVANMFTPPTPNQSWRKVLSMGNLLNGHEPISREIIFSTSDGMSDSHYAAPNPKSQQQELETYRMYISGTSNDLRVALSVVSCD